jgi:hypothetical protein
MTNDDLCDHPIAWQVSAIDGRNDFIAGFKKQPHNERFTDRAAANLRKQALQGAGMGCDCHAGIRTKGPAEGKSATAPDRPVRGILWQLENEAMSIPAQARARQLRAKMRRLLDDADRGGAVCLTDNAKYLFEAAEELREVEDEIDDVLIAQAAGI